ncbi:MAG: hypothetical protein RJA41_291 [Actinomycetota bacterium]
MRIVSWNIQHLEQYDRSVQFDAALNRMLSQVNADVLLLQEVDVEKARTNHDDQLKELSASIGAKFSQFKETRLIPAEDGHYGIGIASKMQVIEWHTIDLPRSPIGRRMTFEFGGEPQTFYVNDHPRAAIAAVLENGYCVINTHLSFMPIAAHLQCIRVVIWAKRIAKKHNSKLVVGGDFNFVGSSWLKLFGLKDAVLGKTFPAWSPEKQIDHLMVERETDISQSQIGEHGPISDHRWIAVEVQ